MTYARRGYGYAGTDGVKTTSENMQEVVNFDSARKKSKHIDGYYRFYFDNKSNCTVFINGDEDGIFLEAGDGLETDKEDAIISSIVVKESGTIYKWMGHY